jgi:hypothetical protein
MSGFCSTLGNFHSAETDEERGNVLFSLFKQLYDEWSQNDCGPCSYEQIVANLYRLSVVEGWEGGAFFFRLFTGASIKEEESTTYVDAHTYTVQEIDDENIHGYVDFLGGPLAALYYDNEEESDDEGEDTYDNDDSFIDDSESDDDDDDETDESTDNDADDYTPESEAYTAGEIRAAATIMGLANPPRLLSQKPE